MHMTVLTVHIAAGALGIIFGFVALFVAKGGHLHRVNGMRFVSAMLTMALIGAVMAVVMNKAPQANTPVGLFTAYLVMTGLTTVRPPAARFRWLEPAFMMLALVVCLVLFTFGAEAYASPGGRLHHMPWVPFFIFGTLALLAVIGDVRALRAGGVHALRGAPRLTRHLWRMSTALLIAVFSFFIGQAKVIPQPIRIVPLLVIPPLVVLAALLYWLWRVRLRRSLRELVVARVVEPA